MTGHVSQIGFKHYVTWKAPSRGQVPREFSGSEAIKFLIQPRWILVSSCQTPSMFIVSRELTA